MPSRADIASQNKYLLKIQRDFRLAVEFVATSVSEIGAVGKIILFGSVARPLVKEVPRFSEYRRAGIAVWHECRDVDLAVWVSSPENLEAVRRAKVKGLKLAAESKNVTVADHQVDVFILEPGTDSYLGRLCNFNKCPKGKGKIKCMAPVCDSMQNDSKWVVTVTVPGFWYCGMWFCYRAMEVSAEVFNDTG